MAGNDLSTHVTAVTLNQLLIARAPDGSMKASI